MPPPRALTAGGNCFLGQGGRQPVHLQLYRSNWGFKIHPRCIEIHASSILKGAERLDCGAHSPLINTSLSCDVYTETMYTDQCYLMKPWELSVDPSMWGQPLILHWHWILHGHSPWHLVESSTGCNSDPGLWSKALKPSCWRHLWGNAHHEGHSLDNYVQSSIMGM